MKKTLSVALGVTASIFALGVVAAVAGPIVYRDVIASPEAVPQGVMPTVYQRAPTTAMPTGTDLSGTWVVADGSIAGYRLDGVQDGNPVTIVGQTKSVAGTFTVADESLTAASISVDLASVTTDDADRDDVIRANTLETSAYPTATFVLTEPITAASSTESDDGSQTVDAKGELTLHGVTKAVELQLTVDLATSGVTVSGSVPVTFSDYGVDSEALGLADIDDDGAIDFSLTMVPDK